jgi:hypothetical protein
MITDSAGGFPDTVNLSGTGTNAMAALSSSNLLFDPQTAGTTNAAKIVTLAAREFGDLLLATFGQGTKPFGFSTSCESEEGVT